MDLAEKKQTPLANQLINTYLQFTNDYQGLNLLAYYLSYRAVVRAKIALFRLGQANLTDKEKIDIKNDYHNFINLAEFYTHPRNPCLIIMHGLSGSGKSTTLAAMINDINENEYGHILTLEDPIEFVHESKKCLINQREIGRDTLSFSNALRSALREDPDIIGG